MSARQVGRHQRILPVLVAAAVATTAFVAFTEIGDHDGTRSVSISTGPSASTSTPSTTLVAVPSVVGTGTAPLPGCVLQNPRSLQATASYNSGDEWKCPATNAEAQEVTGAAVPDPTVPAGYTLGYDPIIYVAPGPISDAVYQRAWAPPGTFTATGATGPYVELRVRAHQPEGWDVGLTQEVTLGNGVQATASFSLTSATDPGAQAVPPPDTSNEMFWSSAGLDYELEARAVTPQDLLTVANSLP
jgi:hypothetical protein